MLRRSEWWRRSIVDRPFLLHPTTCVYSNRVKESRLVLIYAGSSGTSYQFNYANTPRRALTPLKWPTIIPTWAPLKSRAFAVTKATAETTVIQVRSVMSRPQKKDYFKMSRKIEGSESCQLNVTRGVLTKSVRNNTRRSNPITLLLNFLFKKKNPPKKFTQHPIWWSTGVSSGEWPLRRHRNKARWGIYRQVSNGRSVVPIGK